MHTIRYKSFVVSADMETSGIFDRVAAGSYIQRNMAEQHLVVVIRPYCTTV